MKISVFQAVLLSVFGVMALVGLIVFATYTSSTGKSTVGAVTVWGPFPQQAVDNVLSTLANNNKDLKSVTYVQKRPETFNDEYVNAVAGGTSPDLILISQEDLMRLRSTLYPIPYSSISARQFADSFADGASVFTAPGGIYGIPLAIDPLVLYYNKTILSSSGIIPSSKVAQGGTATWEGIAGLVPVVTQVSGQGISNPLIALGTYANVHDARGILSALFLQAGIPLVQEGANGGISVSLTGTTAGGQTPGEAAMRYYTSYANPAQPNYDWNASLPDSLQHFVAGKLALYLGYASELSYLRQANPNLNFDIALFPQPATASASVDYGKIYAFAIPKSAPNQAGAFSTAVALSADDAESALVSAIGTLAPAKKSLLAKQTAGTDDPDTPIIASQALITRGWLSPAPPQTDAAFSAMISSVITGASRVDEALNTAERAISAALQ